MKKRIYFIICFTLSLILLASCGKKARHEDQAVNDDSLRLMETGELAASETKAFVLPIFGRYWYRMKIIKIVEHGTIVHKGDSIIEFDPSEIQKYIIEKGNSLVKEKASLENLKISQSNTISEMEADQKSLEATFNLKKLEMEYVKFESKKTQKIKELQFEQAKINYKKSLRNMKYTRIINKNNLKIQEMRVRQLEKKVNDAKGTVKKLVMYSTTDGIFQISKSRRTKTYYKAGDDVWVGQKLGNVPNLNNMKVETAVNETDITKIKKGQRVIVRMDALPNVEFEGRISNIGLLCHHYDNSEDERKIFDVDVQLLETDERLKPGMTVSCEFLLKE